MAQSQLTTTIRISFDGSFQGVTRKSDSQEKVGIASKFLDLLFLWERNEQERKAA